MIWKIPDKAQGVLKRLEKYKYVLLLLLAGVVLLAWPTGEREAAPSMTGIGESDPFRVGEMEERLGDILSRIEGAGEVRVVLTLRESPRQVLAQDGRATESSGQMSRETSTVLMNKGSGNQEPAVLTELAPVWQGALVVAKGGDDPRVRLALSEAVSALTGLGTDKISICKGK